MASTPPDSSGPASSMSSSYGLEEFVREVREVVPRGLSAAQTLQVLVTPFKRLLANRSFLALELESSSPDQDEVCLHRDAEHRFVVLARGVSRSAQQGGSHAPVPHDHGALWALYGVYEGAARFQRYVPDTQSDGRFPGLRLVSDVEAGPGDVDPIEPHTMHLPLFAEHEPGVVIVMYGGALEAVVRRGYARDSRCVVNFQGTFPPATAPLIELDA